MNWCWWWFRRLELGEFVMNFVGWEVKENFGRVTVGKHDGKL